MDSETAGFIENFNPVEKDINTAESNGVRATIRYEGDTLAITGTYHSTTQESGGAESTSEAFVSNAVRFPGVTPMSEDTTDIFSLKIEKDLGWAQFTSISSITDRELSEIQEGPASTLAVFIITMVGDWNCKSSLLPEVRLLAFWDFRVYLI